MQFGRYKSDIPCYHTWLLHWTVPCIGLHTRCLTRIVSIVRMFNIWVLAGDQSHKIKALINALHCGMN